MHNSHQNQNFKLITLGQNWLKKGSQVALATVINTWGSSPRPVGSQMIFSENLKIEGSVSGGCIESEVIEQGLEIIKAKHPKVLSFGVSNETAWNAGLTCGGEISILVESFNKLSENENFKRFLDALKKRSQVIMIKHLPNGEVFFQIDGHWLQKKPKIPDRFELNKLLKSNKSYVIDNKWFVQFFPPTPRLIIIGAVHIGQTLSRMANLCGFDVEIIDPRQAFITKSRFPKQKLFMGWPDERLKVSPPDKYSAIVTLSHDPKIDDQAITHALNSKAFYIACLGSKKTHLSRLKRLKQKGFNLSQLNRIMGPAGLPINSKTPPEIAVSIMAQLIQTKEDNKHFYL